MQGDFSRWTFNPNNPFTRVLMQQGRVQLDADWNEQVSSLLYYLQALAVDMMGPHGTWQADAFKVTLKNDGSVGVNKQGRYYVAGVLVEAGGDPSEDGQKPDTTKSHLVYLDVWERHLTHLEHDTRNEPTIPGIREVALDGPDTATRAKVVWGVKTKVLAQDFFQIKDTQSQDINLLQVLNEKRNKRNQIKEALKTPPEWPDNFSEFSTLFAKLNGVFNSFDSIAEIPNILSSSEIYPKNAIDDSIINRLNQVIRNEQNISPISLDDLTSIEVYLKNVIDDPIIARLKDVISKLKGIENNYFGDGSSTDAIMNRIIKELQLKQLEQEIGEKMAQIEARVYTELNQLSTGKLKADTNPKTPDDIYPCAIPPDAAYRGAENQLYRVEIHQGGSTAQATFKWSRENGSVIFPIESLTIGPAEGGGSIVMVRLGHLGQDERLSLQLDDWVEVLDDDLAQQWEPGPLLQVTEVDQASVSVKLKLPGGINLNPYEGKSQKHPFLRRWDHKKTKDITLTDGAVAVQTGPILLEDGIEIEFQGGVFRPGDYWLIAARTVTKSIEWPQENGAPAFVEPHGISHYYAPLAILTPQQGEGLDTIDCRRLFTQLGLLQA